MNERDALTARLDQIDSADPYQKNPSLQAERALLIMKMMNINELNTTKLPAALPRP